MSPYSGSHQTVVEEEHYACIKSREGPSAYHLLHLRTTHRCLAAQGCHLFAPKPQCNEQSLRSFQQCRKRRQLYTNIDRCGWGLHYDNCRLVPGEDDADRQAQ
jgi:hypothetical protein